MKYVTSSFSIFDLRFRYFLIIHYQFNNHSDFITTS